MLRPSDPVVCHLTSPDPSYPHAWWQGGEIFEPKVSVTSGEKMTKMLPSAAAVSAGGASEKVRRREG